MRRIRILKFLVAIFFLLPFFAEAHPGGVDANGCHVCHTNCEKYSVPYEVLHCHVKTGTTTQIVIPTPTPSPTKAPDPPKISKPIQNPAPKIEEKKVSTTSQFNSGNAEQTSQISQPFFTKKSILWLSSAGGLGLLAALGFVACRGKG